MPDPENYHLAYNAFCIDKGNPYLSYTDQVDMDGEGIDRKYGAYVDIGADEVYSCDEPLTEDDISSPLDFSHDGILNYAEFAAFSRSWLSRDPNDPTLPTDPNFIDPNDFTNWNTRCDLNEDYQVSLPDIAAFMGDWLWMACWKANMEVEMVMMMSGGDGMMQMEMLMMDPVFAESFQTEPEPLNPYAEMSDGELVSLVRSFLIMLEAADTAIAEGEENAENWLQIKDFFEKALNDIKISRQE